MRNHGRIEELLMQIPPGSPDEAARLLDLGVQLASQRRIHEAIQIWQTVLELDPAHVQAYQNLGAAFSQLGQLDQAKSFLRRALELRPDQPEACFNLANIIWKSANEGPDRESGTIALLRHAIQIRPTFIEAHYKLGSVLIECCLPGDAAIALRQAFQLCLPPDRRTAPPETDYSGAERPIAIESLSFRPMHPWTASICNQLGVAYCALYRYEESEAAYRAALAVRPDFAEAYSNLGILFQEQGRLSEAISNHERSLAINPQSPITNFNLALAQLQSGDFQRGWAGYEWRWHLKERQLASEAPRWDGSPLHGRTILIYLEQGLGDAIQFIRFLPLVKSSGARVVLECPAFMEPLFAHCQGIDQIIREGSARPVFDVQAPLMSLPGILGITLQNLPAAVPYLFVDPQLVSTWKERVREIEGFKIGIVWQGDSRYSKDRVRSIPLTEFLPLAAIPGVKLISLQKEPGAGQLLALYDPHMVLELMESRDVGPGTLIETAAIIQAVDLVIAINSGIAHLAGALAVPVWLALPSVGEWRWLTDREDSPWYPSMRLFCQKTPGNWPDVFKAMAQELRELLARTSR
jgi:tetratricopeptide (TPR) repeat protein